MIDASMADVTPPSSKSTPMGDMEEDGYHDIQIVRVAQLSRQELI